jgi:hypothetical protein
MKSDNKFTYYRTDNNTDLLFQVNNSKKKNSVKKDRCWSRKFGGIQQMNKKEENIPSCSSNTKNEVAVTDLVGIHPSSLIGDW